MTTKYSGTGGQVTPSIFKAYDIRGIVGESLTDDVVYDIGRAIVMYAHSIWGQDMFTVLLR